jgi:3',5'-cyclic AMP phosphodiesterase CpdA
MLILHISDLHFGCHSRFAGEPESDLGRRFGKDLIAAQRRMGLEGRVDLVVVTGDIAETGVPAEFEQGRHFLTSLAGTLGTEHRRFVFVPGNHDVSWAACKIEELKRQLEGFGDAELRRRMDAEKLKPYREFLTGFYGDGVLAELARALPMEAWLYRYPELSLSVAGLNSCERESHLPADHRGEIGREQAQAVMEAWRAEVGLKIAAVHHNPVFTTLANLKAWRRHLAAKGKLDSDLIDRYQADVAGFEGKDYLRGIAEDAGVHLLLHGHHHAKDDISWNGGRTHILSAGSLGLLADRLPAQEPLSLRLIQIAPEATEIRAYSMVFTPWARTTGEVTKGAFTPDPAEPEGRTFHLHLPRGVPPTPVVRGYEGTRHSERRESLRRRARRVRGRPTSGRHLVSLQVEAESSTRGGTEPGRMAVRWRFKNLVIEIRSTEAGDFEASAASDQFGGGPPVRFPPPVEQGEIEAIHAAAEELATTKRTSAASGSARRPPTPGLDPRAVGARLYEAVFQGDHAELLVKCRATLRPSTRLGLRIRLKFYLADPQAGYLSSLPWEWLCDPKDGEFLAANPATPVVRDLVVRQPIGCLTVKAPLRIVVVDAAPKGMQELNFAVERERLETALGPLVAAGEVALLPVSQPTPEALREFLLDQDPHILHFMGHGGYNPEAHLGGIFLVDEAAAKELVDGERLADLLKGLPSLRLVVLNSCGTARHAGLAGAPRFHGAASGILNGVGLPAVVANQYSISDGAAIGFSDAFYRRLAKGAAIDEAITEVRLMLRHRIPEWATPVLFLSSPDGVLFKRAAERPRSARGEGVPTSARAPGPARESASGPAPSALPGTAAAARPSLAPRRLGIRSRVGLAPELEEEAEEVLDLTEYFLERDGKRFIGRVEDWQESIFPRLRSFLRRHFDPRRPMVVDFAAHQSIAFAAGWVYEAKSGLDITVPQRTPGGEKLAWHPKDGSARLSLIGVGPSEAEREEADPVAMLWRKLDDVPIDPAAADIAISLSVSQPEVLRDVEEFIRQRGLPVSRVINAVVREPGHESVRGGQHALRLAQALVPRLRQRTRTEHGGAVHVFAAAPNAFLFYLGQVSKALGRIALYEFAFGAPNSFGRYQKSIELPPPEEVQDLPPGW